MRKLNLREISWSFRSEKVEAARKECNVNINIFTLMHTSINLSLITTGVEILITLIATVLMLNIASPYRYVTWLLHFSSLIMWLWVEYNITDLNRVKDMYILQKFNNQGEKDEN